MIVCDAFLSDYPKGLRQYISGMTNLLNRNDIEIKNIIQTGLSDDKFITTVIYEEKEMIDLSEARKEWGME